MTLWFTALFPMSSSLQCPGFSFALWSGTELQVFGNCCRLFFKVIVSDWWRSFTWVHTWYYGRILCFYFCYYCIDTGKACVFCVRLRLKCDGTRAETRFCLSAKRTSPFKSAEATVQSTTGSRGVRISGSNAGYTIFRGCVKGTGYPLHSPVSPSLPLPCVTMCHHVSTGL